MQEFPLCKIRSVRQLFLQLVPSFFLRARYTNIEPNIDPTSNFCPPTNQNFNITEILSSRHLLALFDGKRDKQDDKIGDGFFFFLIDNILSRNHSCN